MNILVVQPKQEVRDLLSFPLESKFAASVIGASNADEAIAQLSNADLKIDFVIVDSNEALMKAIIPALSKKKPQPYAILCANEGEKSSLGLTGCNVVGVAKYQNLLNDLVKLIGDAASEKESEDGHARVRTNLLVRLSPLDVGVFIKLSNKHFVKMFQKGDVFDGDDLQRYTEKKKVQFLHLSNSDTPVFVKKLNEQLVHLLAQEVPPQPITNDTIDDTVDSVHALIEQIGVTAEVQEVVNNSVNLAMKAMGEFPQLGDILKNLQANKDKYISSHSMVLANIACAMAVALDWYSDATFQKLTMAAFMHDAALRDNELCAVKGLDEFEKKYKGKFNLQQVQEYKGHPEKASLLLGQFKDLPSEVDKIVLQHHEHPYGSGFPQALTGNYISPLSSLFIVAHDLVDHIYERDNKIDMEEFLLEHEKKYSSGNFKKVAKAIAEMLF